MSDNPMHAEIVRVPALVRENVKQTRCRSWLHAYACIDCGRETLKKKSDAPKHPRCVPCSKRIHGHRRHPLYGVWKGIIQRCNNPNAASYRWYGGRGVSVCDEWLDSARFIEWSIANGWMPGLDIDRIDNDGNYEPSNCRYATRTENNRNKGTTKLTPDDVRAIRMLRWSGLGGDEVGRIFGVCGSTITSIMKFKTWKDV